MDSLPLNRLAPDFHSLAECILRDVRWELEGTVIELVFNYVWSGTSIRRNLQDERLVALRLQGVQRLEIVNALNEAQIDNPDRLNWGLSEVSAVRLGEPIAMKMPDSGRARTFQRLQVLWEGDRRIEAVFLHGEIRGTNLSTRLA